MKKAIFIMGVSGAGKRTAVENMSLGDSFESINTCTDRPMRPGEVDGYLYDFVSREQFMKRVDEGDFIEHALVHQKYYYGTRKSRILDAFSRGKYTIKEMEIYGWEKIVAKPDVRSFCRSLFFDISDDQIVSRLRERDATIKDEEIERRLLSAAYERKRAPDLCDFYFDVSSMTKEEQAYLAQNTIERIVAECEATI